MQSITRLAWRSPNPSLSIFRHRAYLQFWLMRVSVAAARQMEAVAIGWQVYELARDPIAEGGLGLEIPQAAFMIGLVGLAQFIPVLLFSLIGGQAADRLNRKMILVISNLMRLVGTVALLATIFLPAREALPIIFSVAVLLGLVNAFTPAAANQTRCIRSLFRASSCRPQLRSTHWGFRPPRLSARLWADCFWPLAACRWSMALPLS